MLRYEVSATVIPLSVVLSTECFLLSIHQPSDCQNRDLGAYACADDLSADGDATLPPLGVKTHGLQAGIHGNSIHLWRRKGHFNLPGPNDRTNNIGLGLRNVPDSCVSQSCLFTYDG